VVGARRARGASGAPGSRRAAPVLATASRSWRLGLVALPDRRRLTFLYGDGTKHSFVVDRDSASVRAKGDAKLEVLVEDEWITLSDVGPAGKAREVEQLFRG
jgi:hypothetical protein